MPIIIGQGLRMKFQYSKKGKLKAKKAIDEMFKLHKRAKRIRNKRKRK